MHMGVAGYPFLRSVALPICSPGIVELENCGGPTKRIPRFEAMTDRVEIHTRGKLTARLAPIGARALRTGDATHGISPYFLERFRYLVCDGEFIGTLISGYQI